MRRVLLLLSLTLTSLIGYGQNVPDFIRTKPAPATGSNKNNQATRDANLQVYLTLGIPSGPSYTLNGAKDSVGRIFYNTTSRKMGIYKGSGVWADLFDGQVDGIYAKLAGGNTFTGTQLLNSGALVTKYGVPYAFSNSNNTAALSLLLTEEVAGNHVNYFRGDKTDTVALLGDISKAKLKPTNGLQSISPDSIGLGGALTGDVTINGLGHSFVRGYGSLISGLFYPLGIVESKAGYGVQAFKEDFSGYSVYNQTQSGIIIASADNIGTSGLYLDSSRITMSYVNTAIGRKAINITRTKMEVVDTVSFKGLTYDRHYTDTGNPFHIVDRQTVDSLVSTRPDSTALSYQYIRVAPGTPQSANFDITGSGRAGSLQAGNATISNGGNTTQINGGNIAMYGPSGSVTLLPGVLSTGVGSHSITMAIDTLTPLNVISSDMRLHLDAPRVSTDAVPTHPNDIVRLGDLTTYTNGTGILLSSGVFSLNTGYTNTLYPQLTGSYANPSWITSLAQSKVTYTGNTSQYIKGDGTFGDAYYTFSISAGAGADIAWTATPPLGGTVALNVPNSSATQRGALTSTDWSRFNSKQAALSGTGFVKISGTTISYDNTTYQTPQTTLSGYGITDAYTKSQVDVLTTGNGANPTALVGLTTINGTATTFMRSDAAPAISQTITPTWLGLHTFSAGISVTRNIADVTAAIVANLGTLSTGGQIQQWQSNGSLVGYFTSGSEFRLLSISNLTTATNANLSFSSTGLVASRNIADANNVLTISNLNASSTGFLVDFRSTTGSVGNFSNTGAFSVVGNVFTNARIGIGPGANTILSLLHISPTTFSTGQVFSTSGFGIRVDAMTLNSTMAAGSPTVVGVNTLGIPTLTASNSQTIGTAATFLIAGQAVAGTNVSIGNSYSLHIVAGNSLFGGNISSSGRIAAVKATQTSAYTTLATDEIIPTNSTSVGFNVTLLSTAIVGQIYTIDNSIATANAVTIVGTVNGTTNYILNAAKYVTLYKTATGTNTWRIIANN